MDSIELEKRGFRKLHEIAEGSYGVVYQGIEIATNTKVALKKMKRLETEQKDGLHFTTIRELKLLSELRHENILGLKSVIVYKIEGQYCLWLISEFMDTNLSKIISEKKITSDNQINTYLYTILKGLNYLHMNWYLHRDLTPSNILMSSEGQLKIADFGFTKLFGDDKSMTPEVVTIWYRAPELLFGAKYYGTGVDIWSFGCIIAELLIKEPFLPTQENKEIDQLATIFGALGTPTEEDWPGISKLPCYIEFERRPITQIDQLDLFRHANRELLDLLGKCLTFYPKKRDLLLTRRLNIHIFNLITSNPKMLKLNPKMAWLK